MKNRLGVVAVTVAFLLVISASYANKPPQSASKSPQTINAKTDKDGTVHTGSLAITKTATVKCVSASGGAGFQPSCTVNSNMLNIGDSITVRPPRVDLSCYGITPDECSALVTEQN